MFSISPNGTFDFPLDPEPAGEKSILPPDRRPRLKVRILSAEAADRFDADLEATEGIKTIRETIKGILDVLRPVVIGWEGVTDEHGNPRPFSPEAMAKHLSRADIVHLRDELPMAMTLTPLEKKRSALRSRSTPVASAAPTETAGA